MIRTLNGEVQFNVDKPDGTNIERYMQPIKQHKIKVFVEYIYYKTVPELENIVDDPYIIKFS